MAMESAAVIIMGDTGVLGATTTGTAMGMAMVTTVDTMPVSEQAIITDPRKAGPPPIPIICMPAGKMASNQQGPIPGEPPALPGTGSHQTIRSGNQERPYHAPIMCIPIGMEMCTEEQKMDGRKEKMGTGRTFRNPLRKSINGIFQGVNDHPMYNPGIKTETGKRRVKFDPIIAPP